MASNLQNILSGKNYIGIECFSINNEDRYAFLQVTRKKGSLEIAHKEIFETEEQLITEKTKLPVILIINNKYVLQKEVAGTDGNDKKLLHKGFPNIQLDDFYYEIWRMGSTSVIAICRKNYIDEKINTFSENFRVASVSLGLCSLATVTDFINTPSVTTNTHEIDLQKDEVSLDIYNGQPGVYDVNGLAVDTRWIIAFAGILGSILTIDKTSGSILTIKNILAEKFKQKAFFEKTLRFGMSLILVLLLINFLLFSHYFKKASEIDTVLSANKVEIERINELKKRISDKEEKLENFVNNTSSKSSLVINKITSSVPGSIVLDKLIFHPVEKRIKEGEAIQPQDSIIIISGKVISNQDFTNWISQIENLEEIKNVTITSFGKENNKTEFSLRADTK
ncbi:general secretion pathway protein [Flavobacterium sp. LaA7.5]|nr:general secretion pathway protein [Flavobacterium salilacus subsp. altitudinum]